MRSGLLVSNQNSIWLFAGVHSIGVLYFGGTTLRFRRLSELHLLDRSYFLARNCSAKPADTIALAISGAQGVLSKVPIPNARTVYQTSVPKEKCVSLRQSLVKAKDLAHVVFLSSSYDFAGALHEPNRIALCLLNTKG